MKKIVLFDLDGTLTDSSEGILKSVRYMLEKRGLKIPDEETLNSFIGPPLNETLNQLYGMNEIEANDAVKMYREYYAAQGMKQLKVYPEIDTILGELSGNYRLAVATSKPEIYAKQIMENTGLSDYFSGVYGADLSGKRSNKSDVIAYALKQLSEAPAVMIGDRKFDILGAKAQQLKSIGVLYGFGDLEELTAAGADQIIGEAKELPSAIRKAFINR